MTSDSTIEPSGALVERAVWGLGATTVAASDHAVVSVDVGLAGELLELGSGTHWVAGEEPERIGKILVDFFSRNAE